ncbi:hypothetical protein [Klebsiella aerogenes]|uniref:hypothetical protein n=1 Tax=Klebsiella aerogenes TaxID=548 RepID=UPI00351CCE68
MIKSIKTYMPIFFLLLASFTVDYVYADSVVITGVTNDVDGWSDTIWWAQTSFSCDKKTVDTSTTTNTDAISCGVWIETAGQEPSSISYGGCPYTKTYGNDTTNYPGCSSGNGLLIINPGEVAPEWDDTTRACVGIAIRNGGGVFYRDDILTANPACVTVPPPPNVLSCHAIDAIIDYGNIPPSAFSGTTAGKKSAEGGVTCTGGDATVKITFSPSVVLLSNGGEASLSFTDNSESIILDVKDNVQMQYLIQSQLSSSSPVDIGPFIGSTTVIAEMQ